MCMQDTRDKIVYCEVPLYATQGGGYATRSDGKTVWHSDIPEFMVSLGAKAGDEIPEEWSVVAINDAARAESDIGDPFTMEDDYYEE